MGRVIEYGLPIDEEELDRIDMSHAKYTMLLEKKYFLAPIPPEPQRILDLGTGTGIWAINVSSKSYIWSRLTRLSR